MYIYQNLIGRMKETCLNEQLLYVICGFGYDTLQMIYYELVRLMLMGTQQLFSIVPEL